MDILFPYDDKIATAGETDGATVGVGEEEACKATRDALFSYGAAVLGTGTTAPIRSTARCGPASFAADSVCGMQENAVGLNWEGTLRLDVLFPNNLENATAGTADGAKVGVSEEEVCAEVGGTVRDALRSRCAAVLGTGTTAPIHPSAGNATRSSLVAGIETALDVGMEDIVT